MAGLVPEPVPEPAPSMFLPLYSWASPISFPVCLFCFIFPAGERVCTRVLGGAGGYSWLCVSSSSAQPRGHVGVELGPPAHSPCSAISSALSIFPCHRLANAVPCSTVIHTHTVHARISCMPRPTPTLHQCLLLATVYPVPIFPGLAAAWHGRGQLASSGLPCPLSVSLCRLLSPTQDDVYLCGAS